MMETRVPAREVFEDLRGDTAFQRVYLSNPEKMVYAFTVLRVLPEQCALEVEAPEGRVAAVCTRSNWTLTFRDRRGAYRAEAPVIEAADRRLVFKVGPQLLFLARRRNIRFAVGGRNPTRVKFCDGDTPRTGVLLDLSLEGMCVLADEGMDVAPEAVVSRVKFSLRGCKVQLEAPAVSHVTADDAGRTRLGFCFNGLPTAEAEQVRHAFHTWYMSQRPSLSTRVDA